jgi:hypothetical protein
VQGEELSPRSTAGHPDPFTYFSLAAADLTRRPPFRRVRSGDGLGGVIRARFGVFVSIFRLLTDDVACGAPWPAPLSHQRVAGSSPASVVPQVATTFDQPRRIWRNGGTDCGTRERRTHAHHGDA